MKSPGVLAPALGVAGQRSRLLSVHEARERLGGISRTTLGSIVKTGRLPVVRIGARRQFFEEHAIDAYIASCRSVVRTP